MAETNADFIINEGFNDWIPTREQSRLLPYCLITMHDSVTRRNLMDRVLEMTANSTGWRTYT